MPGKTIAFLLLRFFAVYWFFRGLVELLALLLTSLQYDQPSFAWSFSTFLAYLIFGFLLWLFASPLSGLLMGRHKGEVSLAGLSREDLYAGGFVIVGAFFLLSSVGGVFTWLHYFATEGAEAGFRESVRSGEIYDFYYPIVTMVFALILIFTGPSWARRLERQRKPEGE